MKVKAKKINNPDRTWLTEGKIYKVIKSSHGVFWIVNDVGLMTTCKFRGCKHIKGDWTIITEPAKVR